MRESVKSYFKAYYLRNREKAIAYAKRVLLETQR